MSTVKNGPDGFPHKGSYPIDRTPATGTTLMPSGLPDGSHGALVPLLLSALHGAQIGVALKSSEGRYLYASDLPAYFPKADLKTVSDEVLFDEDWLPKVRNAQEKVLSSGQKEVVELLRTSNAQYCACECTIQRYYGGERIDPAAILMTFVDLTHERLREDTLKALLREVSHRSKNLLAIVQGIASQTARNSDNFYSFLSKFRGRVAALSSAQDLVTDSNWRGAMFMELASKQLSRYFEQNDPRVTVGGEDVLLSPNGATHVGLALHELISNAVAYGALTNPKGRVALACRRIDQDYYEIHWDEHTGQTSGGDAESGGGKEDKRFGSTVLERVVPSALEAEAEYLIEPCHISYRLKFLAAWRRQDPDPVKLQE